MSLHSIQLPERAAVLALPNALLLPFSLLPLRILQPRYQKLLQHALEESRMFCIALMKEGITQATRDEHFHRIAGIGMIRACVTLPSGDSNLILQGLTRVRILQWERKRPFRVARIEALSNEEGETQEAEVLTAKVLELCSELKERGAQVPTPIERQLEAITDPAALADIVSQTFVRDAFARQKLLEELSVPSRLRRLISELQSELLH